MKIETKFDIGDKVWAVWLSPAAGKFINLGRSTIMGIRKRKHLYCLDGDCWEQECNIFSTEEEAQAECDRRNKPKEPL